MFKDRATGVLGLLALAAAGCQTPTDPPPPPGGGQEYELDFDAFQQTVAPVLVEYGCHAVECHGGGIRGTFELSPPELPDAAFDFAQARLQVNPVEPDRSPLLAKPLAQEAGGEQHSWEPFSTPDHEGYRAIRDWIRSGELR